MRHTFRGRRLLGRISAAAIGAFLLVVIGSTQGQVSPGRSFRARRLPVPACGALTGLHEAMAARGLDPIAHRVRHTEAYI